MTDVTIQATREEDRDWMRQFLVSEWGADTMVSLNVLYRPYELPGFIATYRGERAGLVTYEIVDDECQIVTLDSLRPDVGIGTRLIEAVKTEARRAACKRLFLLTTNDNLHALGFYQRRGFVLAALYPNALEEYRKLKPQISMMGQDRIPLRDAIELEMLLEQSVM
jgi:DNA-3-methyladenine glycosylase I